MHCLYASCSNIIMCIEGGIEPGHLNTSRITIKPPGTLGHLNKEYCERVLQYIVGLQTYYTEQCWSDLYSTVYWYILLLHVLIRRLTTECDLMRLYQTYGKYCLCVKQRRKGLKATQVSAL